VRPGADRLLVFVKAPRPGLVKTRLAATLGDALAADLYRALADRVRARTSPPAGEYDRAFVFAPPDAAGEIAAWLDGETCVPQAGGDLGARMSAAFEWAFAGGAARVVLVGTDAPELSHEDVRAALAALDTHDAAFGPARDGGYYLVALRRPCPSLFDAMAWSTPHVLADSMARAESAGLRVHHLRPLADVDDIVDLRGAWPSMREWLPAELARRISD
jgi:uncharacterized protein